MKFLLVEDNVEFVYWIVNLLCGEDFVVDCVGDGEWVDMVFKIECYDVVLFDMCLFGISGKEVFVWLWCCNDNVLVLMLIVYGLVDDKVDCFGVGVDDYVVKLFELCELVVCICVLICWQVGVGMIQFVCGDFVYVFGMCEFCCGDVVFVLCCCEYVIFEMLMLQQNKMVLKV